MIKSKKPEVHQFQQSVLNMPNRWSSDIVERVIAADSDEQLTELYKECVSNQKYKVIEYKSL